MVRAAKARGWKVQAGRCADAGCVGRRGFTSFPRQDYVQWKKEGRLINDGVNAKVRPGALQEL